MLDKLLESNKDEFIGALMNKLGVSADQADGFLGSLLSKIQDLIGADKLDIADLLKGDVSLLKDKLNLEQLGSLLGGGSDKAEQGINAVMGPLTEKLGDLGGADDLLGKLTGGDGGGIAGALGGIFGKK